MAGDGSRKNNCDTWPRGIVEAPRPFAGRGAQRFQKTAETFLPLISLSFGGRSLRLKLYTKAANDCTFHCPKIWPELAEKSAIVAVDRPKPDKKVMPPMKPPGCVWFGALRVSVLFSEVPRQGKEWKLNPGCHVQGSLEWSLKGTDKRIRCNP
jgi:hypothetical protein